MKYANIIGVPAFLPHFKGSKRDYMLIKEAHCYLWVLPSAPTGHCIWFRAYKVTEIK
jgi:hypothetical protein